VSRIPQIRVVGEIKRKGFRGWLHPRVSTAIKKTCVGDWAVLSPATGVSDELSAVNGHERRATVDDSAMTNTRLGLSIGRRRTARCQKRIVAKKKNEEN
jgi:hypothetical protein